MAAYLSICCRVRQTGMVCGPPAAGEPGIPEGNGDTCHVVVVVKSHRPAFLACARASTVMAKRQQTNVDPNSSAAHDSPVWLRKYLSSHIHSTSARPRR